MQIVAGDDLRSVRLSMGLSQTALAEKIGRTRRYVWSQERAPAVDLCVALAVQKLAELQAA